MWSIFEAKYVKVVFYMILHLLMWMLLPMSKEPKKLVIKLHLSMVESGRSSILNSKEFIFSFGIIFGCALLLFKAL